MRRPTTILTLAIALLASAALPAVAGGPNNVVLSTTTGEGTVDIGSKVQAMSTGTDQVTSTNLARAYSHDCTGCRTVAVALQAVLMTGSPETVAPQNGAFAVNERCSSCTTYAFAYQYVVSAPRARITPAGRQAVADIRAEADRLAHSDLPLPQLDAELSALGKRLKATVDAEIAKAGERPSREEEHERSDGFAR
jgi:hypothetical protein